MQRTLSLGLILLAAIGCDRPNPPPAESVFPIKFANEGPAPVAKKGNTPAAPKQTLAEARKGFKIERLPGQQEKSRVARPPANVFSLVKYDSAVGALAAYLTPDPKDGQKHPAIIWITGGDCNTIGDVWGDAPRKNDQTAAAYRKAGIVMMFPSLRGGNDNPGTREGFYGEVDDVIAAADYLAKQPYVDPKQIYLGGHSTGGTLVLLTVMMSNRFKAVFSFGPVGDVTGYPPQFAPFSRRNRREAELRSPKYWTHSIQSPTFVFEGVSNGNVDELLTLARLSQSPKLQCFPVDGHDHFTVLYPLNQFLAAKILRTRADQPITVTRAEVATASRVR